MMEVRKKSSAPIDKYLHVASECGLPLSWEHYEKMLPQDGFALLGLACHDCLLGPCRINPFDEADGAGVCGLGREGMALRTLRRLAVLPSDNDQDVDVLMADARSAFTGSAPACLDTPAGLGNLDARFANIAIEGVSGFAAGKLRQACAAAGDVHLVTVGGLIPGIPAATAAGHAECALLTGLVDVYVCGNGSPCRGRTLAGKMHTVHLAASAKPDEIIAAARQAAAQRGSTIVSSETFMLEMQPFDADKIINDLKQGKYAGICVLAGSANIKGTQDQMLCRAADWLAEMNILAFAVGDAAVTLLGHNKQNSSLRAVGTDSVGDLCQLLDSLPEGSKGVLFPSLVSAEEIRALLALASSAPALYGTRLPIGGGSAVCENLAKHMTYVTGTEMPAALATCFRKKG